MLLVGPVAVRQGGAGGARGGAGSGGLAGRSTAILPETRGLLRRVRHVDAVQDGLELGRVTALAAGHDQGLHVLALFTRQVDLGGKPAAGASQRVVVWFCREATGRLFFSGAAGSRVLMLAT